MNSILETVLGFFGRQPALPSPPKIPDSAPRIYLRDGVLDWSDMETLRRVVNGIGRIRENTLDLRGGVLDGSKNTHPKNAQSEDARGIRVNIPGFTLVNGYVNDIPGGIIVNAPGCRFNALKFFKPGEDFLSTGKAGTGIQITDSEFWNDRGGDKSIQLNQALWAHLRKLLIVGGETGLRVQKASYNTPQVTLLADAMRFVGCKCGINVDGGAVVRLSGGKFENVKKKWVSGDKQGGKVVLS